MSTQIDERVVAMKFDNRDFKKNINETMSLLDRFKAALNFKGAEKSINEIDKAAAGVKLDGLTNAASAVEVKFSAMSVASIAAINRIVNAAMDAGTRLVKSLSVDQVTAGFDKYEQKLVAMRTIMNATNKSVDEVNASLEKLQWFTDETSYNFVDMVNNIGKFTSNSVDLDTAVTAMQGIANWAAVSGQGVNEASRAMYNLSQAISVGAVKLMDWRSIENANMSTVEFKQTVLDTAAELGTLTKIGEQYFVTLNGRISDVEVSTRDFSQTLEKGWFTSEVLLATLGKYGEYADEIFKITQEEGVTAAEAMEMLGDTSMALGQKAFQAAQEYKTFSDAINATKDAVSSGWMQTFEIIFGNVEEAKELWSALGDELYRIFAENAEQRNQMLQEWKSGGGRDVLLRSFATAWQNLLKIIEPVKRAIKDVFPPITVRAIQNFTNGLSELVKKFQLSQAAAYTLHVIVKALLLPFNALFQVVRVGIAWIQALSIVTFQLADAFLASFALGNPFADLLKRIFGEERYVRLTEALITLVGKLGGAFVDAKDAVVKFVEERDLVDKFKTIFEKLGEALTPLADWLLDRVVDGIEALANADYSNVGNFVNGVLTGMADKLQAISGYLGNAKFSLDGFVSKITEGGIGRFFVGIQQGIMDLKVLNKDFKSFLKLDAMFNAIKTQASAVGDVITGLAEAFTKLIQRLDPAKILVFGFGTAVVATFGQVALLTKALTGLVTAGTGVLNSTKGILDAFKERIKPNKVVQITNSILMLAGALVVLSLVPADRLKAAADALIKVGGGLMIFVAALGILNKTKLLNPEELEKFANSIVKIGAAAIVFAGALAVLSKIDVDGIGIKLVALGVVMAEFLAVGVIMGKFPMGTQKAALQILEMAGSVILIAIALEKLAKTNWDGIHVGIAAMIVVLGEVALIFKASRFTMNEKVGTQMIAMAVAILALVKVLQALAKVNMNQILNGLPAMITIMTLMGVLMLESRLAGKNADAAGKSILAMSAGLILITFAIKNLAALSEDEITKGTLAVSAILAMFGVLEMLSQFTGEHADKMGKNFIAMGAAIMLLGVSISYLGGMELDQVIKGTAVVSALLLMFGVVTKLGTVAKDSKSPTGPIFATTAAIGMITIAITALSSLSWQQALVSVGSLTAVMLAMAGAIKICNDIKIGNAIVSVISISVLLGEIVAAMTVLKDLDGMNMLAQATAISELIGVFGLVTIALDKAKLNKDSLESIGAAGIAITALIALMTVIAAVLGGLMANKDFSGAMSRVPELVKTLLTMVPLFTAFGVLAYAAAQMSKSMKGSNIVKEAIKGTAAVDAVIILLGALAAGIGWLDSKIGITALAALAVPFMNMLFAMSPAITAFGMIAYVLGVMAKTVKAWPMLGALNLDVVFVAITGLAVGVGALMSNDAVRQFAEGGLEFIKKLGTAIGEFIGNILGGIFGGAVETASGGIAAAGANLAAFAENIVPFIDLINSGKISDDLITKISSFASAVTALSTVQVNGRTILNLGLSLNILAPQLVAFADATDNIKAYNFKAIADGVKSLAEVYQTIAGIGEIDQTNFTNFGDGINDLADGIANFAEKTNDINTSNLTAGVAAATELSKIYDVLPKYEGLVQSIFGHAGDMGTFAEGVGKLGDALKSFDTAITADGGIDTGAITAAAGAAQGLADVANALPLEGSTAAKWLFGEHQDLGTFSANILALARGLRAYSAIITGQGEGNVAVDAQAVSASASAAQLLADLSTKLPSTGGILAEWFGETTSLGNFGTQLTTLGTGLASYVNSIKKDDGSYISASDVESSTQAVKILADLADSLPEKDTVFNSWFGGGTTSLTEFGDDLAAFGEAIAKYGNKVAKIKNVDQIEKTANAAQAVANIATSLSSISAVGVTQFKNVMENLSTGGINAFVEEFENSDEKVQTAIDGFVDKVVETSNSDGVTSKGKTAGRNIAATVISGLAEKNLSVTIQANESASKFTSGVQSLDNLSAAKLAGENIVNGFINGIGAKANAVYIAAQSIGQTAIDATRDALDEHSPSVKYYEIGAFCTKGLTNALYDGNKEITKSAFKMGDTIVDATQKSLKEGSVNRMEKIGNGIVQDLSIGILDKVPELKEGMAKVGSDLSNYIQFGFGDNPRLIGQFVIRNIADGITADMSAEEAAEKKASNIVEAFERVFTSIDIRSERADLELDRWELLNENATEEEKTQMKIANIQSQINLGMEEMNTLASETLALWKEGVLTQEELNQRQNDYFSKGNDIIALMKEQNELAKGEVVDQNEAAKSVADWFRENQKTVEFLMSEQGGGMTAQEVMKWVQDKYKWDPEKQFKKEETPDYEAMLESGLGLIRVDIDALGAQVKQVVEEETEESVKEGVSKGASSGLGSSSGNVNEMATQYGNSAGNSYATGMLNGIADTLSGEGNVDPYEMFKGSATHAAEGLVDAGHDWLTDIGDTGVSWAQAFVEGFNKKSEIKSPSKLWYRTGIYCVDGLLNALSDGKTRIVEVMKGLASFILPDGDEEGGSAGLALISQILSAFRTTEDSIQNAIAEALSKALSNSVEKVKPEYFQGGKSIGEQLIEGMVQAVKDGESKAINAIVDAAVKAYQAAVAALNKGQGVGQGGAGSANLAFMKGANEYDPVREKAALNNILDGLAMALDRNDEAAAKAWIARGMREGRLQPIVDMDDLPPQYQAYGEQMLSLMAKESAANAKRASSSSMAKRDRNGNYSKGSGDTYNFTQNNYSPKSLSRSEIYRDTRSLISSAKSAASSKKGGTKR